MIRLRRPAVVLALVAAATIVVPARAALAHPLGNFTVNLYSGLRVQPEQVVVDMVVDMAEIPTFQARKDIDANGDGDVSGDESSGYARRACAQAAQRIDLRVDDRTLRVRSATASVVFPVGQADLLTLRLTCSLVAPMGDEEGERRVAFRNRNYDDRVGWREIVAVGDRVSLSGSNVSSTSLSQRLTQYPTDLLSSPLDQRSAAFAVRPGGAPAVAAEGQEPPPEVGVRGLDRFSRSFTRLVARQDLTVLFALLAAVLAIVLGAVHALAPGHGKTVMAAYLVGQRGSFRQAWLIGITMTLTHTAGVLVLGLILSVSTTLAPETLYPWFGFVSGVLLAAVGANLLYRSVRPPRPPVEVGVDVDVDVE
ncbi:MAG: nickel transporter, partial [Acidimicrobiales bacterium]